MAGAGDVMPFNGHEVAYYELAPTSDGGEKKHGTNKREAVSAWPSCTERGGGARQEPEQCATLAMPWASIVWRAAEAITPPALEAMKTRGSNVLAFAAGTPHCPEPCKPKRVGVNLV